MKRTIATLAIVTLAIAPAAHARKQPPATWQVLRSADPITGASTCAVVATDYSGKLRFTQSGALYPVVEMNSTHGLLVGVSSGGRWRLPTGDILWRVDDRPYRKIQAADNPGAAAPADAPPATPEAVTAWAMRLATTASATSTMASGKKAREMLDEMLAGQSLLFRAAASTSQTGLPDYNALLAGQFTDKGLRPMPLDGSFRDGLRTCKITGEKQSG